MLLNQRSIPARPNAAQAAEGHGTPAHRHRTR